jgi:acetyltransferase-like isoleucine patch superfamily enzyme
LIRWITTLLGVIERCSVIMRITFGVSSGLCELLEDQGIVIRPAAKESMMTSGILIVDSTTFYERGSIWTRDNKPVSLLKHSYCRSPLGGRITLGRYCSIGRNVRIMGFRHPIERLTHSPVTYENRKSADWHHLGNLNSSIPVKADVSRVKVGHDCWIGEGALLKPGIVIGNGVVIGANCVVTKDLDHYSVVVGNPARVVRKRFVQGVIRLLEESRWWEFDLVKIPEIRFDTSPERLVAELVGKESQFPRDVMREWNLVEMLESHGFERDGLRTDR